MIARLDAECLNHGCNSAEQTDQRRKAGERGQKTETPLKFSHHGLSGNLHSEFLTRSIVMPCVEPGYQDFTRHRGLFKRDLRLHQVWMFVGATSDEDKQVACSRQGLSRQHL